jgi:carbonic anhydrase
MIIVLGQEKCGVVTAAASGDKMPTTSIEAIVERIHPANEKYAICSEAFH